VLVVIFATSLRVLDGEAALVEQLRDPGGELGQVRRLEVVVEVLPGLPVLVEEERVRVLDALVQVVVDVAGLLAGRVDQRLQRDPQLLPLARGGAHVGDHGEQVAPVVGGSGHPTPPGEQGRLSAGGQRRG
jgi:hypothetical protein